MKRALTEDDGAEGVPGTFLREASVLHELQGHPSIVELLDAMVEDSQAYLVFELAKEDLASVLKRDGPLSPGQTRTWFKQMVSGLAFAHARRIAHRDLKPANLLISSRGELRICDFGMARAACPSGRRVYTHEIVTLWYRPPEILLGAGGEEGAAYKGDAVDMWSSGCILAEMINGRPIFSNREGSEITTLFAIFRAVGTPTEETWPSISSLADHQATFPQFAPDGLGSLVPTAEPAAIALIELLLQCNPEQRSTALAAKDHPYFKAE